MFNRCQWALVRARAATLRFDMGSISVVALGIAVFAAAASAQAESPLSSRCIYAKDPRICPRFPVGLEDRWFKSADFIQANFNVRCGYSFTGPNAVYLQVDDISSEYTRKQPAYGMAHLDTTYTGPFRLEGGNVMIGAPEPGTQIFNLTLVEESTKNVIDWMPLCLEITPPDAVYAKPLPIVDPDPTVPTSGRPYRPTLAVPFLGGDGSKAPGPSLLNKKPIRVMYCGDCGTFDGMKRFMYSNMRYLPSSEVQTGYLDLTCGGMGTMGNMLLDANVTIFKHCTSCPTELCSDATGFYDFVTNLTNYDTLDQLPEAWRKVFAPVASVLKDFDAIVLVRAGAVWTLV